MSTVATIALAAPFCQHPNGEGLYVPAGGLA